MSDFYTWSSAHPFLAAFVVLCPFATIATSFRLFLRSRNILNRGWPPPHLDADGDFKQEKDDE